MAWIQSLEFVTQAAHFFSAMGCVALAAHFVPLWMPATAWAGYTSAKELVFDRAAWGEGHGSPDWVDWTFNMLGVGFAAGVLLLGGKA
jgi:hypothetical protein